jgi:dihydrofolate reductase
MRNLIFAINLSIDGCCDHTKFRPDEEMMEYFTHLFSESLDSPEGKKTRIVRARLHDEILKLKQEQGKNILTGGITIPSQLAELGLIDEYRFVINPIVIGEGRRLFEGINLQKKLQLKLVESTVFKSGAVALRYLKQ